ncbi:hypothetical protein L798_15307 [Zootermopsis nevadensis]|uniref:MARVEL domain-containing protein n=1 Tax=Zootermopsis nevadensis TaxID=136037 RepID=A0A067QVU9_ZOONE|nr:hypothetical protein L798_15307 [Zootermopsis nevadensis]
MSRNLLTNLRLTTKIIELVLVCIVMGLYINAPVTTESRKIMQFLNPVVLGGYIIVIMGLMIGLIINDRVPRKVDMLYMTAGFILFIAAGSVQIYFHGTKTALSHHTKDKDTQKTLEFTTAAFTIITAFLFLMDAALTYIDDYENGI